MAKNNAKKILEKNSYYTLLAAFGTLAIIGATLLILLAANIFFPFKRNEIPDMETMFLAGNMISFIMFILASYLAFIYLRDYIELKKPFTLGILIMMIALIIFSITSMPLLHMLFGIYGRPGFFSVIPYIFATLSLAILAWLSSR